MTACRQYPTRPDLGPPLHERAVVVQPSGEEPADFGDGDDLGVIAEEIRAFVAGL